MIIVYVIKVNVNYDITLIFLWHNNIAECWGLGRMQKIARKMAQKRERERELQFCSFIV